MARIIGRVLIGVAVVLAPVAAMAQTKQLIYSNGWARDHPQVGVVADEWIRRIEKETQGRVKIRHVPNGTLLKAEATLDGLQRSVADCGALNPAFWPGQLPISSSFGSTMDVVLGNKLDMKGQLLITNKLFNEFPEFSAEFKKLGIRAMVWVPTAPYAIISIKQAKTLKDLEGQKIRGFGPTIPKLLVAMGATPVATASAEQYTSLQTGVIDAGLTDPPIMVVLRLYEVAKNVLTTGPGLGTALAMASIVYACSEESLAQLSEADRERMIRVSEGMIPYVTEFMAKAANDAYAKLQKNGVVVSHLSAAETEKLAKVTPYFDEVASTLDKQGRPGTALVKRYRELATVYLEKGKL